jgi:membrane-bound metal-dependent hydrolase YbcI (DUF457 family)
MTARTHDLAAISAFGLIVTSQPIRAVTVTTALIAVIANQIGGIAPDIDQPTAPFWRNLPIFKIFGKFAGKLLGGHRFITHSLIGLVLAGFGVMFLLNLLHQIVPKMDVHVVWWAFMVGMISHLITDMFTKEGIPLLLPIPIKIGFPPLKKFRLTTGKIGEKIFFIALAAIDIWYYSVNYQYLVQVFHNIQ